MEKVAAVGEWLYDGSVPTTVRVVRLDYDFWFGIGLANGDLQPDERPCLNAEGHAFYVRSKPGWVEGQPFWPDSIGYMTLNEAKREAESKVLGNVRWP